MKTWIALVMICALAFSGTCLAAEWPEGLSAAQPYSGVSAVDLDLTMGYMVLTPRAKLPASCFCDRLGIYLPREDVRLESGALTLYSAEDPVVSVDFSDEAAVSLRPMTDEELEDFIWGGGTCIEVRLPFSLTFDAPYHVRMEEGCFSAADGRVRSLAIDIDDAWQPVLTGDYGVSNLRYHAAVGEEEDGAEGEAGDGEAAAVGIATNPGVGGSVDFELIVGGAAVTAVVYSENGSVEFGEPEYTESASIHGEVTGEDFRWAVVFLSDNGEVLDVVSMGGEK